MVTRKKTINSYAHTEQLKLILRRNEKNVLRFEVNEMA